MPRLRAVTKVARVASFADERHSHTVQAEKNEQEVKLAELSEQELNKVAGGSYTPPKAGQIDKGGTGRRKNNWPRFSLVCTL